MKILEKGPGWGIEKTCMIEAGGCGSKLLIERDDIYAIALNDWGDRDFYYKYKCPVCGMENNISEKDIPAHIKELKLEELINDVRSERKTK